MPSALPLAYAEAAPDPRLAPYVRCYWMLAGRAPVSEPRRILPDGCADVLVDVATQRQPMWVGTMTRPLTARVGPVADTFGVRFTPGGLAALSARSIEGLTDATAELDAWRLPELDGLLDQVCGAGDWSAKCRAVDAALLRVLPRARLTETTAVLRWLERCESLPDVASLARRVGWSARTLERRFLAAIGVGPKQHLRFLRFERALRLLEDEQMRNADIAAEAAYVDEAHFIHEFRRFAGETPAKFRRSA